MAGKRRVFYIILIILISGLAIQMFRTGLPERLVPVNQKLVDDSYEKESSKKPDTYQEALLLYSDSTEGQRQLYDNISRTFEMAKINFKAVPIKRGEEAVKEIAGLDGEDLLVIAAEIGPDFEYPDEIENYAANGGNVVFPLRFFDGRLDGLSGIRNKHGFLNQDIYGFSFDEKIFPGLDNLSVSGAKLPHSSLDLELESDAQVLASTEGIPLIWEHSYGKGRVLYFNTTMLMDKGNRGILLQYFSCLPEYFLSTVINGKIVNIDDFPAPVKRGENQKVKAQYHIENVAFYKDYWWSDMYNISVKYDLKYTGMIIGTYNDDVTIPIEPIKSYEKEDIQYFGRKLGEVRGELGIHGYNHNSLALEGQIDFSRHGYKPWESRDSMEQGLKELKSTVKSIYGDIPIFTYVPPSNMIGPEGKESVKKVFDTVMVYAGLYTGLPEKGVLYQEFGKDPDVPGTYDFPRISAGYDYNDEKMWNIYNGIAHYGIVNHFIHPDDLLDPERSGSKSWQEMQDDFESIFRGVRGSHPYLRPMTNYEAVKEYIRHEDLNVFVHKADDSIVIDYVDASFPVYHYLRLNGEDIDSVDGGTVRAIDSETGLYLLESEKTQIIIRLR